MKNFITAFGEHFNGNPNLAFVDIRSYGDCGEGNGSIPGYTVNTTQANLSDNCYAPYVKAFPNTQFIVPWTGAWFDGKPADAIYVWLVSKGAGMRRDGICSTWSKDGSECLIAYPHAPAVMEYALTWPDTVAAGMDKNTGLRYDSPEELLLYVLNGKASYMQWHPEFYEQNKEFCRDLGNKMGYHFILKEAEIPNRIQPGVSYPFKLTWLNDGVAPFMDRAVLQWLFWTRTIMWSRSSGLPKVIHEAGCRRWSRQRHLPSSFLRFPPNTNWRSGCL